MIHRTLCIRLATELDSKWTKAKRSKPFLIEEALHAAVRGAVKIGYDGVAVYRSRGKPVFLAKEDLEEIAYKLADDHGWFVDGAERTGSRDLNDDACEVSDHWAAVRHSSSEYESKVVNAIGPVLAVALDRLEGRTRGDARRKVRPR